MIMSVEELRTYITTTESDAVLANKLAAIELLIRQYTNNNFQKRAFRKSADITSGLFIMDDLNPFSEGDTVQVSESQFNDGLFTVDDVTDTTFTVNEATHDESNVLVTLVEYPVDIKMGVVNMMDWDLNNRDKVGIQSETISRHSVTYFNMDGDNSLLGYPKSLTGFLQPYKKARF